ncbi:helicase HerA domain-containing protein [Mycolicibacterium goodii]|uniref:ATPase AAA n=1 Tax=Mycolicibacterium goodii TaxID=134601 RepID=A0A0K0X9S7_MYCGD|nr:ATPase AAA [Mycolicibacterium goodii]
MQQHEREALGALRLTWAPTADDLWHSQGALHVPGLHERALADVLAAFDDAEREADSSPLGVVVRGPAGSGKTHLLGQVRERVQTAGGFFFLVELLDATSFWQSARAGILESLGRPGAERETQLKDLLWELASIAHISRANRRAIIGDDDLTPEILTDFVNALHKARRQTIKRAHHTLRALVLLGAADLDLQDIGEAFLVGNVGTLGAADGSDRELAGWGLPVPSATPQESVRDISRLVALAGPAVLALDQIDTLLAQSTERTSDRIPERGDEPGVPGPDNRDLEHVAHGLMSVRQTMRRTVSVVACLPAAWEAIQDRATASVHDRFRTTALLQGLPTPDIGRAILERRFSATYNAVGYAAPYPSWPILPSAFDDATQYTPRQLLKRADAHIRRCLERDTVEELTRLTGEVAQPHEPGHGAGTADTTELDRRFAEYRRRAVTAAALDPDGEDTTMPGLLSAALEAWITELGEAEQTFWPDPPPGQRVVLHARLRQSLDAATDDERHWAFRAIASGNAIAVQNRIRKALEATGLNPQRRTLCLLRNTPWPRGAKTAAMIEEFTAAGGRVLPMSDDDIRTMTALRDLIDDNHPDLPEWLRRRRPAHGIDLLRAALGDVAGDAGELPEPYFTEPETVPQPVATQAPTTQAVVIEHSPTAITLGVDATGGQPVSVDLAALRKHTAMFAGSGSGKTVLIRRLVEECALRGVSSIVLDPNNDLSRLGSRWPELPPGWNPADNERGDEYFADTEVVVWTPRRSTGRPLSFQPLPDFASVLDDDDEFSDAVESAVAALEPRALIVGNTAKANRSRAVLREALRYYGASRSVTLSGFIDLLGDLPDDVSALGSARALAAELGQNLRAATVNDPLFGGAGTAADPGVLLTPSPGYRARVSVISMVGLTNEQQREGFVNQLQMALFAWIKRHPAGDRPLGGLLVMDEAQNFAPSSHTTASTHSTLALSSQARKYGLGLVFATQSPRGLHNHIPGNSATQFYGLLNSPAQIAVAREMARVKGGLVPDISRLRSGQFYLALEGNAFHKIQTPWCLSHHPPSPPTTDEVLALAQQREPATP